MKEKNLQNQKPNRPPIKFNPEDAAAAEEIRQENEQRKKPLANFPIRCQGYQVLNKETGELETKHAEGHTTIEFVPKASRNQSKRCKACQKKQNQKRRNSDRSRQIAHLKRVIKAGEEAQMYLIEYAADFTEQQAKDQHAIVDAGKLAEIQLENLKGE